MSAGAINSAASVLQSQQQSESGAAAATGENKFAQLSSTEFVNILVKELTNQNPFKPQDSSKILKQLSSLRTIESQTQLQDQLESLVSQNEVAQASGMIGKMVQGLAEDGDRISGLVTSVRVRNDQAILELDTGKRLPMSRVERITDNHGGSESTAPDAA